MIAYTTCWVVKHKLLMNSLAECLSCCSPLKVSVLQNVNWVSGANGVPAWRRTKHVASEKDPSHGTVGPFCWSTAQTPLPLPLFPHKLALHRQRGGSAQWSRHLAREVRGRQAAFKKRQIALSSSCWSKVTAATAGGCELRGACCMQNTSDVKRSVWWDCYSTPPGAVAPASMSVPHRVLIGFGLAELAEGYRISWLRSL